MVTANSKNCYYDYHMFLGYEVNLIRNFWKIWDLAEEVVAERWEWASEERRGLQSWLCCLFRSLSPSGRPIPQDGTTGFHPNEPEIEVSGHRDKTQG